jgi:hypothetical protein
MLRRFVLAALLASAVMRSDLAQAQDEEAMARALEALQTWQQPDGGLTSGFVEGSDVSATADAVLGIVAAGVDPGGWMREGNSPLDYLASQAAAGAIAGPGQAAKVAIAVTVVGLDARDFGGTDLVAMIYEGYDPVLGFFGGGPFDSALAVVALVAADEALPEGAIEGLVASRLEDGSFSFNGDPTPGTGDSNTTALVVQALVAAGSTGEVEPSLAYFRVVQNEDGGWTYQKPGAFGEETDANSTALVMQALLAAGEDLAAWNSPDQTLRALQVPSGAFIYTASSSAENVLATLQAIPVLAHLSYADVAQHGGDLAPSAAAASDGRGTTAGVVIGLAASVLMVAALIAWRRTKSDPAMSDGDVS